MKKRELIEYLGGTAEKAAIVLGFAHRNSVQRFESDLTGRQSKEVCRRMTDAGINYPKEWDLK